MRKPINTKTTKTLSQTVPRLAWSIIEAATVCGVSASFIRKQIAAGKLKRIRLGRRVLIRDSDLNAWVNQVSR